MRGGLGGALRSGANEMAMRGEGGGAAEAGSQWKGGAGVGGASRRREEPSRSEANETPISPDGRGDRSRKLLKWCCSG